MRDLLENLIAKFNAKVDSDPALGEEIGDMQKTVLIALKDGTKWHFTLKDRHVAALLDGGVDKPDLTLTTDAETLRALLLREMGPFKAYATGRLKFTGSLDDLLRFRKFF